MVPREEGWIASRRCGHQLHQASALLALLDGILILFKDTLLDQLFGARPVLQALFQAVGAHMHVQLLLVALQGGRCSRVGQDVAVNQLGSVGTAAEALLEVVGCALSLELESFGLEGADRGRAC